MLSWGSLTMTLILCLTLTDMTEANEAILIGTVYCDTCFHQHFSSSSHFISGALVAVECGGDEVHASGGRSRFRKEVKTNVKGEFRALLPFSATKYVHEIKECSINLISSSEPNCSVAAISTATSASFRVKVKTPKYHVFSAGYFTFQPLKQPKRCQWESHANSNDESIATTPLPSPAIDGILAPSPSLTDENLDGVELHDYGNNFGSSLPLNQPPRYSKIIPEVPSPPDSMLNTGFQPPPDSMINAGFQPPPPDSMFNTGFQPPPDSMLNTGFQRPPPDSRFNTGFQPPPDSMPNMGFQPPPPNSMFNRRFRTPPPDSMSNTGSMSPPSDSMSNTGFQSPPPDSMSNTGIQSPPPDSMSNTGFQSPPSDSMFNPNPSQPPLDSTFDPSPPSWTPQLRKPSPPPPPSSLSLPLSPPPPFIPLFPAFPFQPSAGLPRMPPRTTIPPLFYK
ncbi:hypothetical protein QVD17_36756 [Tagetes erecta]|uniref:Uncharacterized protein n=1 Tax=Tagetes erecta TaxID=13708 RepID=A0AAD8NJ93_TARER|nr:hypothetical protein QVD17_36756 [Tagetes erecta]